MLALAVLVLQSVVTSAVYAVNEGEEVVPEMTVETVVSDPVSDESNNNEVVTNLTNSEVTTTTEVGETTSALDMPVVTRALSDIADPEFLSEIEDLEDEEVVDEIDDDSSMSFSDFVSVREKPIECGSERNPWCVSGARQSTTNKNPGDKLDEWEVWMWKLVQPTDNPWEYEISIAVKGQPKEEVVNNKVCAAVVFDKSNSMIDVEWKWEKAVNWAITFSQTLRDANSQSYIWLVIFWTTANQARNLSKEVFAEGDFWWKPDGSNNWWTNLHAWLIEANSMLKSETCNDATKYIVVMSDGVPTFFEYNGKIMWDWQDDDSVCVEWEWWWPCKKSMKPSEAAIEYANSIRNGIEIFAVWYEIENNQNAQRTLKKIADDSDHFFLWKAETVASNFQNIAETISKPAWTNAHVTDNLWENFETSYKEDVYEFGKITAEWKVYTFKVRIKDPSKEKERATNAWVVLTYTDVDWNPETLEIKDSAFVNWVLPTCDSDKKPEQAEWVLLSDVEKFIQSWDDGKLIPETKSWEYTESTTLWACERTCDSTNWYVRDWNKNACKKQTYTVTFNSDWGTEVAPQTVEYNGKATQPENPTRGSTEEFDKWMLNGSEYNFDTPVVSNITLLATYKCIAWYKRVWGECKKDTTTVDVTDENCKENAKPANSHYKYETEVVVIQEDWTYAAPVCEWECNVNEHYILNEEKNGCELEKHTVTFNSNWGTPVEAQTVEYNGRATKPENPTRNSYTFQGWTLSGQTFDFTTPITWDITLVAQWKSNWWWGWGSSSYECRWTVPAHAIRNGTRTRDRNKRDYTYGTESGCTFQCESEYTWNGKECTKWGGNWWWDEIIELGWQVSDKCSVEWSNYSEEEKAAYLYACENDITTIRDIEEARLWDFLTRAEMAKMISVFATKELWMKPNTSKDCSNFADSIASYSQEMKDYMVMSCQLEIMWIHTTNYKAIPDFMPSKYVSRAEFGTVLSRILWWNKHEGTNDNYYVNHLNALKENSIITNIDPTITEYRAWVFLMFYRSVEAMKSVKANTTNETVEEQVNAELQAETGSVVEVKTWSVAEAKTWDVIPTTWDASKETAVETGSTVETWSTNN